MPNMRKPIEGWRAFNEAQNPYVTLFSMFHELLGNPILLPKFANFLFKLKWTIVQSKPASRISLEFDGHLSSKQHRLTLEYCMTNIRVTMEPMDLFALTLEVWFAQDFLDPCVEEVRYVGWFNHYGSIPFTNRDDFSTCSYKPGIDCH